MSGRKFPFGINLNVNSLIPFSVQTTWKAFILLFITGSRSHFRILHTAAPLQRLQRLFFFVAALLSPLQPHHTAGWRAFCSARFPQVNATRSRMELTIWPLLFLLLAVTVRCSLGLLVDVVVDRYDLPKYCPREVQSEDFIRYHFNGTLFAGGKKFDSRWSYTLFIVIAYIL